MSIYYWRVWKQDIGIVNHGNFEANNKRQAKQLASEESGRVWNSDWRSEGCSIYGAKSVSWKSELDNDNKEVILFVYQME